MAPSLIDLPTFIRTCLLQCVQTWLGVSVRCETSFHMCVLFLYLKAMSIKSCTFSEICYSKLLERQMQDFSLHLHSEIN